MICRLNFYYSIVVLMCSLIGSGFVFLFLLVVISGIFFNRLLLFNNISLSIIDV